MDVIERNNVKVLGEKGPVLPYAHGFGCSQAIWSRITPACVATHQQVMFDCVGSGLADCTAFNPKRYDSLVGHARDVIAFCEALGLRDGVTFVGHSVSCSIGLLASIALPMLFDRLDLLGPSPCFLNHPPGYLGGFEREDLEGLLALMDQNYMGWAHYLAPVVAGLYGAGAATSELSASFCPTDPVMARVFARATFFADSRADLPKVSRPSPILQHKTDSLAPIGVGEFLHAQLCGSTRKMQVVAGHCAHLSNPALVVDAMRASLPQRP